MVLSLLFGGSAQAGLTVGVGLGGLMDLPGGPFDDGCGGRDGDVPYPQYKVDGADNYDFDGSLDTACSNRIRFGGQLVVPVRIHLGQLAAVKVVPGVQATSYNGAIEWSQPGAPDVTYTYQGHTAFAIRPNVAVGGEFAFLAKGITPYAGASVSVGAAIDIHSLGLNGNGEHGETMGAYDQRGSEHCNQIKNGDSPTSESCKVDAQATSFALGGELAFGVRTADPSRPGFFVEGVFNAFSMKAGRVPNNYPDSVRLGASKINPFGITAGLLIPL